MMSWQEEAIEAYRWAVASRPDFAEAWYGLGAAFHIRNQLTEAIDAYRRVVAIHPDHPEAWNMLAGLLKHMGQHRGTAGLH